MPFTPFHFGPGLLLKAALRRHLSLSAFAVSQVAVDLEPLYFILRGDPPVHRAFHTVWVAGLVGLAVGVVLWAGVRRVRERWSPIVRDLAPGPALLGGLVGGVSHAWLDGLMHRDVFALRPLADTQWVLGAGGVVTLHAGCALAGALGAVLLLVRARRG